MQSDAATKEKSKNQLAYFLRLQLPFAVSSGAQFIIVYLYYLPHNWIVNAESTPALIMISISHFDFAKKTHSSLCKISSQAELREICVKAYINRNV